MPQPWTNDRPDKVDCPSDDCQWTGSFAVAAEYDVCPICGRDLGISDRETAPTMKRVD